MIYRLLPLLALAVLIVGIVVLSGTQRETTPAATVSPARDPGYSALKAHLVQTGPDGRPIYTLDAAQIQQEPDAGLVNLSQVQLGFRDTSGDVWTARADRGELAQNSGIVSLAGNVHVDGVLPGSEEQAQIATEHLAFDTNAQIVATRDPVTIVMTGRQLSAQGLIASLKERHVQLESAVHGSFVP